MKKTLLLLMAIAMCAIMANAVNYEINIAGVEVTSNNANYITGGAITSGYGVYNASTNTLSLYNISINRNGQDNYGIHNRKCDNLTIVFNGYNDIITSDNALKLERSTTLTAAAGSETLFYSAARICANLKSYTYYIKGSGEFSFMAQQSGYEAIKGEGSAQGKTYVSFQGAKVTAKSTNRSALKSLNAYFYSGAHLEIESNGSDPSVDDVVMQFYGNEAVISPYQAAYSYSAKSVCVGSTPITDKKIIISDDYVAILNSTYFPDTNFRNKLYNYYFSKGYINSTDVANTTSISVVSSSISNLTGIGYFTNLKRLGVNGNNLTSLPSLPNSLEELFCYYNSLTSLPTLPSSLKVLVCYGNHLTSLPTLPNSIQRVEIGSNNFSGTLTITGKPNLNKLDVGNCANLKILNCYSNALTTLYVQNCSAMTTLDCHGNLIPSLSVSGCTGLTTLDCGYNQLSSLDVSSLSNLTVLNCRTNKLTSLNVSNKTKLTQLEAQYNQLTSINVQGCSSLNYLMLESNKLSSLSVQGCNALRTINCCLNKINASGANTLINSLCTIPSGSQGVLRYIFPGYSSGSYVENNVNLTDAQVRGARNKRWIPYKFVSGIGWVEIPVNTAIPGDVNGDGHVSSVDVTALYNYLLNNDSSDIVNGDQDGDGHISSVDVTVVYNILLGN